MVFGKKVLVMLKKNYNFGKKFRPRMVTWPKENLRLIALL